MKAKGRVALKKFQQDFCKHIRNPKKFAKPQRVPPDRMKVYTELLFNSIEDVLAGCFPICKEVLGKKKWTDLVRSFFTEHACEKPFYRQVPEEFVAYLSANLKSKKHPTYLPHLAHYEWLELDLYVCPDIPQSIHSKKDLLRGKIVFRKPCRLVSYPFPVHEIKKSSRKALPAQTCYYFFYRTAEHAVDWMQLNAAQAKLIHLLMEKKLSLSQAAKKIAQELKLPIDFIEQAGHESLLEFQKKGIILGCI